jgi:hypothetical protein
MSVSSQSGGRATVVFSSIAQHTDHLDRCTGQASILQQGSTWLVDHIDVNCVTDGAPGGKKAKRKPPKAKQKPPKH